MEHKSGCVSRISQPKKRSGRVGLAVGAAAVVVAATGVAFAGDDGPAQSPGVLATPGIDAEEAREAAVRYLMAQGMSAQQARQRMANQSAALQAATELRQRAPNGVGSFWLDDDGNLQVQVSDQVGAAAATAVGATAVVGTLATADLETVRDTLAEDAVKDPPAGLSGAVFEVDEAANKVVARYLFAEPGGVAPQAATDLGDLVTASVEVASIIPQQRRDVHVAGARMEAGRLLCTTGWAVDIPVADGGVPKNGVMTAGHCFKQDANPDQTKAVIYGGAEGSSRKTHALATGVLFAYGERGDYGVLELGNRYRGRTKMVDGTHVVKAVQEPVVGAVVCKNGVTTGRTCGEIQALDILTLSYTTEDGPGVLLKGMARVAYCGLPGDSGAPVYADYDEGRSGASAVAAIGINASSVVYPDDKGEFVCGEKIGQPNDAYFTPLSGIDTEGKFSVRIDGG